MIIYDKDQFEKSLYKDLINVTCSTCGLEFQRTKAHVITATKRYENGNMFCCRECHNTHKGYKKPIEVSCKQCDITFLKQYGQIKQTLNNFCSRSCAATYNNQHKKHGTRRSKLEAHLEEYIRKTYPSLILICNSKEAIESELDFYFPELNLAIELNGIFHYEPIYGKEKLEKIQNNDDRKFQACLERNIELCIIDSSHIKNLTEKCKLEMEKIIKNIIDKVLENRR